MNKATQGSTHAKTTGLENEGEGNKTAARHYNDATRKFVESGKVDEAASKAKEALNGPEGEELRRAEAEGKAKAARPRMQTEGEDLRRAESEGMVQTQNPSKSN